MTGQSVVYIHTIEKYLPINRNEVLIHVTKWMDLENIMLPESQTPKTTYCMIPFTCNVQKRKIQRDYE